jgi:hypothetical protein
MNETDCTLQSLWQKFDVSFHVVNITGSKSESPKAKIAAPIGQGTHQVWLANIDEIHWLPVWKQPITTVQIPHTCTNTRAGTNTTVTAVASSFSFFSLSSSYFSLSFSFSSFLYFYLYFYFYCYYYHN